MAYTLTQLTTLEAAIAEGVFKVKYEDREIVYRTLTEMLRIRDEMRRSLGLLNQGPHDIRLSYRKGLE